MGHEKESAAVNGAGNTSGRELHSTHLNFSKRPSICQQGKTPERPKMRPNRKFYRDFCISATAGQHANGERLFFEFKRKGVVFYGTKASNDR